MFNPSILIITLLELNVANVITSLFFGRYSDGTVAIAYSPLFALVVKLVPIKTQVRVNPSTYNLKAVLDNINFFQPVTLI